MKKAIFINHGRKYFVEDVIEALRAAGVEKNDSVFVHSDLRSFGKLDPAMTRKEFLDSFLTALCRAVGDDGNIIMPTFSYSFCKHEIFEPEATPSTVGVLTEHFRRSEGVKRSDDAIFSAAARGPAQDYFTEVGTDCFGKGSIFEKLYDRNAKLVFLGDTFDITFMHFVEQRYGVPYRFIKVFEGGVKLGDALSRRSFRYNVRRLDGTVVYDLERIADYLDSRGVLRRATLGRSTVRVVTAVDAFNGIMDGLKDDLCLLLKNENTGTRIALPA